VAGTHIAKILAKIRAMPTDGLKASISKPMVTMASMKLLLHTLKIDNKHNIMYLSNVTSVLYPVHT
jgi:hypothetical protein